MAGFNPPNTLLATSLPMQLKRPAEFVNYLHLLQLCIQVQLLPDASAVRGSNVEYYRESKPALRKSVPALKASTRKPLEVRKEVQANVGRKTIRRTRVNTNTQNGKTPVSSSKSRVDGTGRAAQSSRLF